MNNAVPIIADLSPEELRSVKAQLHRQDIRSHVLDAVTDAEDLELISFRDFASCDFDNVADEESFRSAFVDYVTDEIIQCEELYDRDPFSYTVRDFNTRVLDCAEDLNIIVRS